MISETMGISLIRKILQTGSAPLSTTSQQSSKFHCYSNLKQKGNSLSFKKASLECKGEKTPMIRFVAFKCGLLHFLLPRLFRLK
jgi:hypothetical protein